VARATIATGRRRSLTVRSGANGWSWLAQRHARGVAFIRDGDPTELVRTLLEASLCLASADYASVWLAETSSLLVTAAQSDDRDAVAARAARELGAAVAHAALASDESAISVAFPAATDPTALREALAAAGVQRVEAIPLRVGDGAPMGVLALWFRRAPGPMAQSSVPAVLARQVADFLDCRRTREQLTTDVARAQETAASAATRRRDDFLAMLSHELRQPLAATLPAIEVQKRSDNPEPRRRATEIIEQQLRQVVRLVDDLTDLSHIQRGSLHLRRERVDLRTVLRQAIDATSAAAVAKHHLRSVQLGAAPAWALVDVGRMTQVFSNLLQNASTYTPGGGHITIALTQSRERIDIGVRDDGAGIQADDLERMFRPCERAAGIRDSPGLGIGLALVRQIVEMHGGTVCARSDGRGRGSEFVLSLPVDST